MTKTGLIAQRGEYDMPMRWVCHRNAKRLRTGIGLSVRLGLGGLSLGRAIGICRFLKCESPQHQSWDCCRFFVSLMIAIPNDILISSKPWPVNLLELIFLVLVEFPGVFALRLCFFCIQTQRSASFDSSADTTGRSSGVGSAESTLSPSAMALWVSMSFAGAFSAVVV